MSWLDGKLLLGKEKRGQKSCIKTEYFSYGPSKDAEVIDDVDFETPEDSGTSSHIRVNTGNGNNLNVMSSPSENGTVLGQFANGKELTIAIRPTIQNETEFCL